jgi:hypothetical protein
MTTSFNVGVDWNRKGLICWDARPDDALNILPRPLTYSTIDYRKSGVVSLAALQLLPFTTVSTSSYIRSPMARSAMIAAPIEAGYLGSGIVSRPNT